jgi:hypothetical protein
LNVSRENITVIAGMILAFLALTLSNTYIPQPYGQTVGGVLYIICLLGSVIGSQIWMEYSAAQHPCLHVIVRPQNEELWLYVAEGTRTRKLGDGKFSQEIPLSQGVKPSNYGVTIKKVVISHVNDWSKRVHFKPGKARFFDYEVSHPLVETIEVYQTNAGKTGIDHADPVPTYVLHSASLDYYTKVPALAVPLVGGGTALEVVSKDSQIATIQPLKDQLAEERRKAFYWHQQVLDLEDRLEEQKAETRGLLGAKGGVRDYAIEYVLTLLQAHGDLMKVKQALMGNKMWTLTKWAAVAIISVVAIFYHWNNPQYVRGFSEWMQSPNNQLVFLVALGITMAAVYYIMKRGRR